LIVEWKPETVEIKRKVDWRPSSLEEFLTHETNFKLDKENDGSSIQGVI
jgi:hypothetical protein